jgi:hypothetical protein
MNKKRLNPAAFFCFLMVWLTACGGINVIGFNDKLVGIQKKFSVTIDSVMSLETNDAMPTRQFEVVQEIAREKIREVEAVKAPEDGEAFKNAMMADFNGVIKSYDILIHIIKSREDPVENDKYKRELEVYKKEVERLDNKLTEEQNEFAKKHHFRVEVK